MNLFCIECDAITLKNHPYGSFEEKLFHDFKHRERQTKSNAVIFKFIDLQYIYILNLNTMGLGI